MSLSDSKRASKRNTISEISHIRQETYYEAGDDIEALREKLHKIRFFCIRITKERKQREPSR